MRSAGLLLSAVLIQAQAVPAPATPRDVHTAISGTASLDGVVTVIVDGHPAPLRRAKVVATSNGGVETTDTDTSGRFHLDHLVSGTCHVVVNKFGFVPAGRQTTLDLKDNDHATTSILMQRGAAIEGRLTTEDGDPAIALTVSAGRLGYGPYGRFVVAVEQTTTDDLGRYRVHTLPPGEYYLEVAPDPVRMMQVSDVRGAPRPTRTHFAGATGLGTSRLNEARVIPVDAGQQASGFDFTLLSDVLSTVTAKVSMSVGTPPASFSLRIQRVGAPPGEVRCFLPPGGSGGAECPNVPPGDFWVLVAARASPNAQAEYSATRLTVAGRDATVAVTTAPWLAVTGRVDTEDGVPLPPNLQVVALGTDYELPGPTPGQPLAAPSASVSDGAFTLSGVVGPRLLRVTGLPAGWTVKSVTLGTTDVSDIPTTFAATSGSPAPRLVVTSHTGALGGVVLDGTGQPAAGSRILAFSADSQAWHARSRAIAIGEVAPDGHYVIQGLLPGRYFVAVVNDLADGEWEDPEYLARLQPSATAIVVTAGTTATLDWRPR